MAGSKESSRQKMIGMMYLVLTALLALNVSREVLEAFNNITRGIDQTLQTTHEKNANALKSFEKRVEDSGGDSLALVCWSKLQSALETTSKIDAFIEQVKREAVEAENSQEYDKGQTSFLGSGMTVLVEQENVDIASRMLADSHNPNYGYGEKLKNMINEGRSEIVSLFADLPEFDEDDVEEVESAITLRAEDDLDNPDLSKRKWEYTTFNNVPLGAALAVLTKIQNDIKNVESEVISRLHSQISVGTPVIGGLQAMVRPRSSVIAVGEKFEADIFLGAKMGSIEPEIKVEGQDVELKGSTGKFEASADRPGKFSKDVEIHYQDAGTGETKKYTTQFSYDVYQPTATVSAESMKVLYKGLDNPVSVSVPGYEPERVTATLSPADLGTITRISPGNYVVKLNRKNPAGAKVTVSVRKADGSFMSMEPSYFRTKSVPAPYANILNRTGDKISRAALRNVRTVNATMDPNFPFEGVRYKVSSYDYIYTKRSGGVIRGTQSGQRVTGELKAAFDNARSGDMFVIRGIEAKLVNSTEKVNLPSALVFEVE